MNTEELLARHQSLMNHVNELHKAFADTYVRPVIKKFCEDTGLTLLCCNGYIMFNDPNNNYGFGANATIYGYCSSEELDLLKDYPEIHEYVTLEVNPLTTYCEIMEEI